ncbi:helix-turn-helix transcriptional regulator, partial [Microcystis sp. M49636_WE2]
FEDLGFNSEEATNLKIRADLMLTLRSFIQEKRWTQQEAATFFEETKPKISDLMNGEISRFTVDKLLSLLDKTGIKVKLEIFTK